jgi:uncharacterized membrane protein
MGNVHHDSPRFWRSPGLLIGIGLGGFADGILLHQVLQWHNQLWRAGTRGSLPRSGRHFTGQLVLGWGLFNLIEGLLDHQLLGIHHVREGPTWLAYDLAFLGLGGLGLLLLGLVLSRRPRDRRRAVV